MTLQLLSYKYNYLIFHRKRLSIKKQDYTQGECNKWKEVKNEDFISLSGAKHFRAICDKFCKKEHIHPNIVFESDSPIAVKNMISANIGIGFWPSFSWEQIDTKNVKLLKIANTNCTRDILVTYKNNKTDDQKTRKFYTFLIDFIEKEKKATETYSPQQNS